MAKRANKKIRWRKAPAPGDPAWRLIADDGGLSAYRDGDVLLAWDAWNGIDKVLAAALERHLLKRMGARLGKWLGNRRYGPSHDIWKSREQDFSVALHRSQTTPGGAIRKSFVNFADWGTLDLVRADLRQNPGHESLDDHLEVGASPEDALVRVMDLKRIVEDFAGGDRRRLTVAAMGTAGFPKVRIAAKAGVSEQTVYAWLDEFELLKQARGIG